MQQSINKKQVSTLKSQQINKENKQIDQSQISGKSLRSIASQKFQKQYTVQEVKQQKKLDTDTQNKLQTAFQKYDSGKLNKQQFKEFIQKDLNLTTNDKFEQKIKLVDAHFVDIMQGIDKQSNVYQQDFKPNTFNTKKLKNIDNPISLLQHQQNRISDIKYEGQNEDQKFIISQIEQLIDGNINKKQFQKELETKNLMTNEIGLNMREFESANSTNQSQLAAKLYRSVDQKLQQNDQISYQNCGINPNRSTSKPLQPINSLAQFNPQVMADDFQIDVNQVSKEYRLDTNKRVYCEKKASGQFKITEIDNGDIFQWQSKPKAEVPQKQRKINNLEQKTNINLKLEETKNEPYQEKIKQKNLQQMKSDKNLLAPNIMEKIVSPSKNIAQLMSSGNIIGWQ